MTGRDEWKAARKALDDIEAEREALIAPARAAYEAECRRLLAPSQDQYDAAVMNLDAVADRTGEPMWICEGCGDPIFSDEPYHAAADCALCAACAPSYADMVASPQNFVDLDSDGYEKQMTRERAQEILDAHVDSGGSADDKMVSP